MVKKQLTPDNPYNLYGLAISYLLVHLIGLMFEEVIMRTIAQYIRDVAGVEDLQERMTSVEEKQDNLQALSEANHRMLEELTEKLLPTQGDPA